MSNYPPGVTGNEPEIAGYPDCGNPDCRHAAEDHAVDLDPHRCEVPGCDCDAYEQYPRDDIPD